MKAIYGGVLYAINRDTGNGVELVRVDAIDNHELFYVGYDNPGLILDPTDGDIEEISPAQRIGDEVI